MAAHDIVGTDRKHRPEHFVLLLGDRTWSQRCRGFHRGECHDLKKMRDNHVSIGASGLVEVGTLFEPEGLWNIDLDVIDHVSVPDGFEQAIGEAERQNVQCGFLTQEVIDTKHL